MTEHPDQLRRIANRIDAGVADASDSEALRVLAIENGRPEYVRKWGRRLAHYRRTRGDGTVEERVRRLAKHYGEESDTDPFYYYVVRQKDPDVVDFADALRERAAPVSETDPPATSVPSHVQRTSGLPKGQRA
jgi:hypothetical protein